MRRWLAMALVVLLATGGAVAALAWSPRADGETSSDAPDIPSGSDGDRARFRSTVTVADATGEQTRAFEWTLEVDRAEAMDRETRTRATVRMRSVAEYGDLAAEAHETHLDAWSREIVQHEHAWQERAPLLGVQLPTPHVHADKSVTFGPVPPNSPRVHQVGSDWGPVAPMFLRDWAWSFAAVQARDLEAAGAADALAAAACAPDPTLADEAANCAASVAREGQVLRVTLRQEVVWRERVPTVEDGGAAVAVLARPLAHVRQTHEETLWLRDDLPYPIEAESATTLETSEDGAAWRHLETRREHVETLGFAAGSGALWAASPPDVAPRAFEATWGAEGATYPENGDGWEPTARLEDVVAAAESDPTLVDFREWRAQHPDARLAWAHHRGERSDVHTEDQGPFNAWHLLFAAPGTREGYALIAETSGSMRVEDISRVCPAFALVSPGCPTGRVTLAEPFDASLVPTRMLTFSSAVEAWRLVARQPAELRGADTVGWGLALWRATPQEGLAQIDVAEEDGSGAQHAAGPGGHVHSLDTLLLDARTGDLIRALLFDSRGTIVSGVIGSLPPIGPTDGGAERASGPDGLAGLAAGAAVAGALLAAYFFHVLKFALTQALLPLYSRLRRSALLDNAVRDALVARIREEPGISPPALQQATRAGWSTIVYHLDVLERHGLVRSVIDGRHKRFFVVGDVDAGSMRALAVLRNARTRQALELLRARGPLDRTTLARALGVSVPSALWHLTRLAGAGLVREERGGRVVLYHAQATALAPARLA